MKKTTRQLIQTIFIITIIISAAILCHILSHHINTKHILMARFLDFTRTFLYIGLFATWGISIEHRVTQPFTQKMLCSTAALMVFWLVIREIKFRFVTDGCFMRYLWYLYYIPILMIPLLTLFVSFSLGESVPYLPPRWSGILLFITLSFILCVLTNDLHQQVFLFPKDPSLWSETNNHYHTLYYVIVIWILFCALWAFIVMLKKLKIPQSRNFLWLPVVPFLVLLSYSVLYYFRTPFFRRELNDFAVIFCLSSAGVMEACIQCGLIPSNTCYYDLFKSLIDIPIQILDTDYHLQYASDNSIPIDTGQIQKAMKSPRILRGKKLLHCIAITVVTPFLQRIYRN